jgi:rSAM/selenodomain-associated transferase 1
MNPSLSGCAVAIMAKVPTPGQVKTRLCPPLSHADAAELYRCLLLDKIEQVKALDGARQAIAYTPEDSKSFFEALSSPAFLLIPQVGPDLGARLTNTLTQLLALGYQKVMAIDSDSPTLPVDYLRLALDLLNKPDVDVVLGPCEDGGYYLIGLREIHRELFDDMAWSSPHVLPETIRRAEAKRLKVACLPAWYDVDTPEDLQRLRFFFQTEDGTSGQHTKRFLVEYDL